MCMSVMDAAGNRVNPAPCLCDSITASMTGNHSALCKKQQISDSNQLTVCDSGDAIGPEQSGRVVLIPFNSCANFSSYGWLTVLGSIHGAHQQMCCISFWNLLLHPRVAR
jgi:hypothetical protein